jgi:CO dehydrogenase maturation factor
MAFSIAVAGKGGSGKTTIASLVIRYLLKSGRGPILAVDADPNANLADSLGLTVKETIGSIIAAFNDEKLKIPPGMTKEAYLEYRLNQAIVEDRQLDLIAMGRGEGPDCYCYPNLVLRNFIDSLAANYAYVVMDNEAGLEHLSRRTTRNVDELLMVSNHTVKGIRTLVQVADIATQLKLGVGRSSVIINLTPPEVSPAVTAELARLKMEPEAFVPLDEAVGEYDLALRPLLELPDDSPAVSRVNELMDELIKEDTAARRR